MTPQHVSDAVAHAGRVAGMPVLGAQPSDVEARLTAAVGASPLRVSDISEDRTIFAIADPFDATVGFIVIVGRIYVGLSGDRPANAVEVAQSPSPERVVESIERIAR